MDLKVDGEKFTISGEMKPAELLEAAKAAVDELTKLTGRRTQPDGLPMLFANPGLVIRAEPPHGVHIALATDLGWVIRTLSPMEALGLIAEISAGMRVTLQQAVALGERSQTNASIQ